MKEIIRNFKLAILQWLEGRLIAKVEKLNAKLKELKKKIKAESARVQKRLK